MTGKAHRHTRPHNNMIVIIQESLPLEQLLDRHGDVITIIKKLIWQLCVRLSQYTAGTTSLSKSPSNSTQTRKQSNQSPTRGTLSTGPPRCCKHFDVASNVQVNSLPIHKYSGTTIVSTQHPGRRPSGTGCHAPLATLVPAVRHSFPFVLLSFLL